jgi:hypothetical protein
MPSTRFSDQTRDGESLFGVDCKFVYVLDTGFRESTLGESGYVSKVGFGFALFFLHGNTATYRAEKVLRITGDTHTKGVKTAMTARDMENGHSISVLIRNRRRHEWQLNSAELYTLLTLADEQRLARPSASSYKVCDQLLPSFSNTNVVPSQVQIMVIHRHWIQRLSVQIPSLFLTSIIGGKSDLVGNIHIHRTPWFNFMEEQGRRGALQAVFEHFPLKTTCTLPPLPPIPTTKRLRDDTDTGFTLKKKRTRRDQSYITATASTQSRDVQVTSVERST